MFTVRDLIDDASLSAIRKELQSYSRQIISEFEEICPVERDADVFIIDVFPITSYLTYQNGTVTAVTVPEVTICLKKDNPWPDFWKRWDRFCKLKAFW